jgi:hypothetical protein
VNTEERRLSDWLHAQTPEPPRPVPVDDIAARARRARPPAYRRWVPVIATACAVLAAVAIALVVSAHVSNRSRPVAPATTSPTAPPSKSPTPSTSPTVPAGMNIGAWGATTLGGAAAHDIPLAGNQDSLFVNDGKAILRLAPTSGAVLARRSYPGSAQLQALIAADALWTAQASSGGTVKVRGLGLNTLTEVATVTVHMPGRTTVGDLVALDVNAKDRRIYVGINNSIAVIDAAARQIVHQYQITNGLIADLAINPDDTRLYVTANIPNSTDSSLIVLDPDTGATIVNPIHIGGGTGFQGITASTGGIWLETGSGMTNWLNFRPASHLALAGNSFNEALTTGGGGYPVTSTVTASAVWLGGTTKLACADPVTGKIRASVRVPTPHGDAANISRITVAGSYLFAYYMADAGPSELLIKLSSPTQCTN